MVYPPHEWGASFFMPLADLSSTPSRGSILSTREGPSGSLRRGAKLVRTGNSGVGRGMMSSPLKPEEKGIDTNKLHTNIPTVGGTHSLGDPLRINFFRETKCRAATPSQTARTAVYPYALMSECQATHAYTSVYSGRLESLLVVLHLDDRSSPSPTR